MTLTVTTDRVWVWSDKCGWRPAIWVRTIDRGKNAGMYEVLVGYHRRRKMVLAENVRFVEETESTERVKP